MQYDSFSKESNESKTKRGNWTVLSDVGGGEEVGSIVRCSGTKRIEFH